LGEDYILMSQVAQSREVLCWIISYEPEARKFS